MDDKGQIKLADFGASKQVTQDVKNSLKGTPAWMVYIDYFNLYFLRHLKLLELVLIRMRVIFGQLVVQ